MRLNTEALLGALRAHPRAGSAELCRLLGGVSRATLMRGLRKIEDRLVARGEARRTKYALRRALRGSLAPLPLYAIDEAGRGEEVGRLDLLHPSGSALALSGAFPWPLDEGTRDGWFDGLPYPLMDARPQGFIGRNFAHRHALDLAVSENPEAWSEEDIAHVLSTFGHDQPGNLILGDVAYRRFLDRRARPEAAVLSTGQLKAAYPRLAEEALAHGAAVSSAGGEFPKFTARRRMGGGVADVIVKFSGADASPAVRRWADLLVCEHLALETMAGQAGIAAAKSAILRYEGRTFLEVVRFDRHGEFGRSAACTLTSLNAALVGAPPGPWQKAARRLHQAGWLAAADVERIAWLWWFGRLIANTDMHEGNLAFRPGLELAPAYDMLPMAYAPLRGGELPARNYAPELPLPDERDVWSGAATAASAFWHACAKDERIGAAFRRLCGENGNVLDRVRSGGF